MTQRAPLIRPAVRDALWRWREVIAGLAVAAFGLWWLATFFSPVAWIGWAFVALGLAFAIAGLQRARFRKPGIGPGVVQVIERRLSYFGPLTGGGMDLRDITRLELEPAALPAPHWVLTDASGQVIEIPVNAKGADALFDAFATLPGIKTQGMLDVLSRTPDARVTVWFRANVALQ